MPTRHPETFPPFYLFCSQEALWAVIGLVEARSYDGGATSPAPSRHASCDGTSGAVAAEAERQTPLLLVRALGPLLHVYQLPGPDHMSSMLALLIRWVPGGGKCALVREASCWWQGRLGRCCMCSTSCKLVLLTSHQASA